MSPWVVALDALAPYRVPPPAQDPRPLHASGTVSGPDPRSYGSMIELTWRGAEPLTLSDGSRRAFLEDGDTVTLRGYAGGDGDRPRIGFGAVTGRVEPAPTRP